MLNGDLYDIDNNLVSFKITLVRMPKRINRPYKFSNLPYWKELKVTHLLDPIHMFKNELGSLWKHISSTKKDTNASTRDLVVSKQRKNYKKEKQLMWLAKNISHCMMDIG